MGINEKGVIYYEINPQNTNEEIFLNFAKNLICEINKVY